jgi:hypothetical protein
MMVTDQQPAPIWKFTPPLHLMATEPTIYGTGSLGAAIRELDRLNFGRWYSDRYTMAPATLHPEIIDLISELR